MAAFRLSVGGGEEVGDGSHGDCPAGVRAGSYDRQSAPLRRACPSQRVCRSVARSRRRHRASHLDSLGDAHRADSSVRAAYPFGLELDGDEPQSRRFLCGRAGVCVCFLCLSHDALDRADYSALSLLSSGRSDLGLVQPRLRARRPLSQCGGEPQQCARGDFVCGGQCRPGHSHLSRGLEHVPEPRSEQPEAQPAAAQVRSGFCRRHPHRQSQLSDFRAG